MFVSMYAPADVVCVVWVWLWLSVGVVAADDHVDEVGEVLPLQELLRPLTGVGGADGDLDPVVLGVECINIFKL